MCVFWNWRGKLASGHVTSIFCFVDCSESGAFFLRCGNEREKRCFEEKKLANLCSRGEFLEGTRILE